MVYNLTGTQIATLYTRGEQKSISCKTLKRVQLLMDEKRDLKVQCA